MIVAITNKQFLQSDYLCYRFYFNKIFTAFTGFDGFPYTFDSPVFSFIQLWIKLYRQEIVLWFLDIVVDGDAADSDSDSDSESLYTNSGRPSLGPKLTAQTRETKCVKLSYLYIIFYFIFLFIYIFFFEYNLLPAIFSYKFSEMFLIPSSFLSERKGENFIWKKKTYNGMEKSFVDCYQKKIVYMFFCRCMPRCLWCSVPHTGHKIYKRHDSLFDRFMISFSNYILLFCGCLLDVFSRVFCSLGTSL